MKNFFNKHFVNILVISVLLLLIVYNTIDIKGELDLTETCKKNCEPFAVEKCTKEYAICPTLQPQIYYKKMNEYFQ